jgi:hypothetical protein
VLPIVLGTALGLLSGQSGHSFEECLLRVPVNRPYRVEPEERAVVLETLLGHFKRHPVFRVSDLCIAGPGHAALSPEARARLQNAGVMLDTRADCRYEVGRDLWSVDGAWRIDEKTFVVHVARSQFGDVSVWLAAYEYRLTRTGKTWKIASEKASPCNPGETVVGK